MHLRAERLQYNIGTIYSKDKQTLQATTCPMAGEWLVHFKLGLKLQTIQTCRQNEAFMSDRIKELTKLSQTWWAISEMVSERECRKPKVIEK